MKRTLKWIGIAAGICGMMIAGCFFRFPPDPLTTCQKQFDSAIEQWMLATGNDRTRVYPNIAGVGRTSVLELAPYIADGNEVLADYGYVPGLQEDDPSDLVMMYLLKKTRRHWNGDHSGTLLREPKWMVIGPGFTDEAGLNEGCYEGGRLIGTSEFRARLQRTMDFLKANNRTNWETVVKEQTEFLVSLRD